MKNKNHKYAQVAAEILRQIENGELTEGARLPAARTLGDQLGVHYHTVRQAYLKLSAEGFLEVKSGSGTFVTGKGCSQQCRGAAAEKVLSTSDRIGVLFPMKQWGYYVTNLIAALHRSAERQNLKLNIVTVNSVNAETALVANEFLGQGCCAVLLPWVGKEQHPADLHDFVRACNLPVVIPEQVQGLEKNWYRLPEQRCKGVPNSTVLRGWYFHALGYRKIAMLGAYNDAPEHLRCKVIQYLDWVSHEKLPSLFEMAEEGGGKDMNSIIDRWLPMKGELAVIAYHDDLALEFIDACRARGLRVPEDFAVMGHNKNPAGMRNDVKLSTMLCPYDYIADGMVSHAIAMSQGSAAQLDRGDPQSIVVRETCGGRNKLGQKADTLVDSLVGKLKLQSV